MTIPIDFIEKQKEFERVKSMQISCGSYYKCPKCRGEFNEPARDGTCNNSTGNPKCPWCGEQMKGL